MGGGGFVSAAVGKDWSLLSSMEREVNKVDIWTLIAHRSVCKNILSSDLLHNCTYLGGKSGRESTPKVKVVVMHGLLIMTI